MNREVRKPSVLMLLPTPPPYAGMEIGGSYLLKSTMTLSTEIHHVRSNIRSKNEKRERVDLEMFNSFARILFACVRILLTRKIDIMYFPMTSNRKGLVRDLSYFLLGTIFRKRMVAHYKGGNYIRYYQTETALFRWLINILINGVELLIVESKSIMKDFLQLVPTHKLSVVHPGIYLRDIITPLRDFSANPLKLLYFGNISLAKGIYELSIAFNKLKREGYDIELHLAGELVLNRTVLQWIHGERLTFFTDNFEQVCGDIRRFVFSGKNNGVIYYGVLPTDKIYELCLECHVLVFLSYSEGFSVSVMESLVLGMPMILTSVGAVVDYLSDGINCCFVKEGNPGVVYERIKFLFENRDMLGSMSRNNIALSTQFDVDKIGTDLSNLFASCAFNHK